MLLVVMLEGRNVIQVEDLREVDRRAAVTIETGTTGLEADGRPQGQK